MLAQATVWVSDNQPRWQNGIPTVQHENSLVELHREHNYEAAGQLQDSKQAGRI
jgi:hypothetical protein